MKKPETGSGKTPGVPPRQDPLRTAREKSVEALRDQSQTQFQWLGAEGAGARWRLPVLDRLLQVDTETGQVTRDDGEPVHPNWMLLSLHYLAVRTQPPILPPTITFASLASGKTYASVYQARVNDRLCARAGRDATSLRSATAAIGARAVEGGDLAFEVQAFPRIPLRLIWYAGDDELAPSCTILLAANIESFLCTEDIVVLSESLVSRLGGRPL